MFSRTQGHTHHIFCPSPSFSSSCSNWKVAVVDMDMRLPGCPLGRTCLGSKWPAAHCPCRALQRDASPEITPFPGQPTSKQELRSPAISAWRRQLWWAMLTSELPGDLAEASLDLPRSSASSTSQSYFLPFLSKVLSPPKHLNIQRSISVTAWKHPTCERL